VGVVPQGMKTDGVATWDGLYNLLTNVVRLKTMNPAAQRRTHVYLTKRSMKLSVRAFNTIRCCAARPRFRKEG